MLLRVQTLLLRQWHWCQSCIGLAKEMEEKYTHSFVAIKQKISFTDKLIQMYQTNKKQLEESTEKLNQTRKDKNLIQSQLELLLSREEPSYSENENLRHEVKTMRENVENLKLQLHGMDESRRIHEESIKVLKAEDSGIVFELRKKHKKEITDLREELAEKNFANKKLTKRNKEFQERISILRESRKRMRRISRSLSLDVKGKNSETQEQTDIEMKPATNEEQSGFVGDDENTTSIEADHKSFPSTSGIVTSPRVVVDSTNANDVIFEIPQRRRRISSNLEHKHTQEKVAFITSTTDDSADETFIEKTEIAEDVVSSTSVVVSLSDSKKKVLKNRMMDVKKKRAYSSFKRRPTQTQLTELLMLAEDWNDKLLKKPSTIKDEAMESLMTSVSLYCEKHFLLTHEKIVLAKLYKLHKGLFTKKHQTWLQFAMSSLLAGDVSSAESIKFSSEHSASDNDGIKDTVELPECHVSSTQKIMSPPRNNSPNKFSNVSITNNKSRIDKDHFDVETESLSVTTFPLIKTITSSRIAKDIPEATCNVGEISESFESGKSIDNDPAAIMWDPSSGNDIAEMDCISEIPDLSDVSENISKVAQNLENMSSNKNEDIDGVDILSDKSDEFDVASEMTDTDHLSTMKVKSYGVENNKNEAVSEEPVNSKNLNDASNIVLSAYNQDLSVDGQDLSVDDQDLSVDDQDLSDDDQDMSDDDRKFVSQMPDISDIAETQIKKPQNTKNSKPTSKPNTIKSHSNISKILPLNSSDKDSICEMPDMNDLSLAQIENPSRAADLNVEVKTAVVKNTITVSCDTENVNSTQKEINIYATTHRRMRKSRMGVENKSPVSKIQRKNEDEANNNTFISKRKRGMSSDSASESNPKKLQKFQEPKDVPVLLRRRTRSVTADSSSDHDLPQNIPFSPLRRSKRIGSRTRTTSSSSVSSDDLTNRPPQKGNKIMTTNKSNKKLIIVTKRKVKDVRIANRRKHVQKLMLSDSPKTKLVTKEPSIYFSQHEAVNKGSHVTVPAIIESPMSEDETPIAEFIGKQLDSPLSSSSADSVDVELGLKSKSGKQHQQVHKIMQKMAVDVENVLSPLPTTPPPVLHDVENENPLERKMCHEAVDTEVNAASLENLFMNSVLPPTIKGRNSISPSTVLCTAISFGTPSKDLAKTVMNKASMNNKTTSPLAPFSELQRSPSSFSDDILFKNSDQSTCSKAFPFSVGSVTNDILKPRRFSCEAPERAVTVPPIKPIFKGASFDVQSSLILSKNKDLRKTSSLPPHRREGDVPSHWHSSVPHVIDDKNKESSHEFSSDDALEIRTESENEVNTEVITASPDREKNIVDEFNEEGKEYGTPDNFDAEIWLSNMTSISPLLTTIIDESDDDNSYSLDDVQSDVLLKPVDDSGQLKTMSVDVLVEGAVSAEENNNETASKLETAQSGCLSGDYSSADEGDLIMDFSEDENETRKKYATRKNQIANAKMNVTRNNKNDKKFKSLDNVDKLTYQSGIENASVKRVTINADKLPIEEDVLLERSQVFRDTNIGRYESETLGINRIITSTNMKLKNEPNKSYSVEMASDDQKTLIDRGSPTVIEQYPVQETELAEISETVENSKADDDIESNESHIDTEDVSQNEKKPSATIEKSKQSPISEIEQTEDTTPTNNSTGINLRLASQSYESVLELGNQVTENNSGVDTSSADEITPFFEGEPLSIDENLMIDEIRQSTVDIAEFDNTSGLQVVLENSDTDEENVKEYAEDQQIIKTPNAWENADALTLVPEAMEYNESISSHTDTMSVSVVEKSQSSKKKRNKKKKKVRENAEKSYTDAETFPYRSDQNITDLTSSCEGTLVINSMDDVNTLVLSHRQKKEVDVKFHKTFLVQCVFDLLKKTKKRFDISKKIEVSGGFSLGDLPQHERVFIKQMRLIQTTGVCNGNFISKMVLPLLLKIFLYFPQTSPCCVSDEKTATARQLPSRLHNILTDGQQNISFLILNNSKSLSLIRVFSFLCKLDGSLSSFHAFCRYTLTWSRKFVLKSLLQGLLCWPKAFISYPGFGKSVLRITLKQLTSSQTIVDPKKVIHLTNQIRWVERQCGWEKTERIFQMQEFINSLPSIVEAKLSDEFEEYLRKEATDVIDDEELPIPIFDEKTTLAIYMLELLPKEATMEVVKVEVLDKQFWPLLNSWARHIHVHGDVEEGREVSNTCTVALLHTLSLIFSSYLLKQRHMHKDQQTTPKLQSHYKVICGLMDQLSTLYLTKAPRIVQCATVSFLLRTCFCNPTLAYKSLITWAKATSSPSIGDRSKRHRDLSLVTALSDCKEQILKMICDRLDSDYSIPGDGLVAHLWPS